MSTDKDKGRLLTRLARAAIAHRFGEKIDVEEVPDWMKAPGAVFVTLTQYSQLRGCIGSLQAYRPLVEDLVENAQAAAFRDPRFLPLTRAELPITQVEVSLLSRPEVIRFSSQEDARRQLRPDIDGVILEYRHHRATFLPQVWEQLPEPEEFLRHLKLKAGLPDNFWADDLKLYRYTVEKFKEDTR